VPKTPLEHRLDQWRALLEGTINLDRNYAAPPQWTPTDGSQAAVEVANTEVDAEGNPWGPRPVQTAYALANLGMGAILDHLSALLALLAEQMPILATTVLSRAALEMGAQVWWLMEPGLGARRRVARYQAIRLDSAEWGEKAVKEFDPSANPAEYGTTSKAVITEANALGLKVCRRNQVEGESPGTATALTTAFLNEFMETGAGAVYRTFSGVAHGKLYGLFQFVHETGRRDDGEKIMELTLPLRSLRSNIEVALAAFVGSFDRVVALMGWDTWAWDQWHDHLIEAFQEDWD
jgi:hypothetical protein